METTNTYIHIQCKTPYTCHTVHMITTVYVYVVACSLNSFKYNTTVLVLVCIHGLFQVMRQTVLVSLSILLSWSGKGLTQIRGKQEYNTDTTIPTHTGIQTQVHMSVHLCTYVQKSQTNIDTHSQPDTPHHTQRHADTHRHTNMCSRQVNTCTVNSKATMWAHEVCGM